MDKDTRLALEALLSDLVRCASEDRERATRASTRERDSHYYNGSADMAEHVARSLGRLLKVKPADA